MPIIRTIRPNDNTLVGIWKITESIEDLSSQVVLSSKSKELLKNRKSRVHKLQFLSIRAILLEFGYSDQDLSYINNSPILNNGKTISISQKTH